MSALTTAERARVNAVAAQMLAGQGGKADDYETLRAALRDIAFGAEMMQGVGDPSSAFNRYAAEVQRVARAALAQVSS